MARMCVRVGSKRGRRGHARRYGGWLYALSLAVSACATVEDTGATQADTTTAAQGTDAGAPTSATASTTHGTSSAGPGDTSTGTDDASSGGAGTTAVADAGTGSDSTGTAVDDDPYRACDYDVDGCFEPACAFAGSDAACCNLGDVCAPICDGDVSLCPVVDGFEVACMGDTAGEWSGHCAISCPDGTCPDGMMCSTQAFGSICTYASF